MRRCVSLPGELQRLQALNAGRLRCACLMHVLVSTFPRRYDVSLQRAGVGEFVCPSYLEARCHGQQCTMVTKPYPSNTLIMPQPGYVMKQAT